MGSRSPRKTGAGKGTEQTRDVKHRNGDCGAGKGKLHTEAPGIQVRIWRLCNHKRREGGPLGLVAWHRTLPGSSRNHSAGACYGAWPSEAPWPLAVARSRLCPREMTGPWALQNSWTTWDNSEGLHFRTQVSTNCGRQSISVLAGPVQTAARPASWPPELKPKQWCPATHQVVLGVSQCWLRSHVSLRVGNGRCQCRDLGKPLLLCPLLPTRSAQHWRPRSPLSSPLRIPHSSLGKIGFCMTISGYSFCPLPLRLCLLILNIFCSQKAQFLPTKALAF